jgi:Ribosomal protein L11 methyltransferase (PrmA)
MGMIGHPIVQKNTVLVASSGVEAGLDEPSRAWVRVQGRQRVTCGSHVFEIIAIFREPRSLQDAFEILAARATGPTALVEAMTTIDLLQREGVLVEPADRSTAPRQLTGFSAAPDHIAMLNDRTRTDAFLRAIHALVKPGDVVMDLGSGTGVLAMAAAQAGAARVYAIEAGAMADCAAALFARSGFADRITLVRRWSTTVTIEERADVLITETLGDDPWGEGILALVSDARRRFLQPAARIIPSHVRWLALPVGIPAGRQERLRFSDAAANRWGEWYGIDFRPLVAAGEEHAGAPFLGQRLVSDWPRLSPPIVMAEIDLAAGDSMPRSCDGRVEAAADGAIDGMLLCWEATLSPANTLSTVPGVANLDSSWQVQLLLLPRPVDVTRGDLITVSIERRRPLRVSCVVTRSPRTSDAPNAGR